MIVQDIVLPKKVFRQDVVYRTAIPSQPQGVRSCGVMLKPTAAGAYRERVMDHYILVYVLRGKGVCADDAGREYPVEAGCAIQLLPNQRHGVVQVANGQWAEFYVSIESPLIDALVELGSIDTTRMVLRPGLDLSLIERFEQLLHDMRHGSHGDMPRIVARAHELVVAIGSLDQRLREPDSQARMVEAACVSLNDHLERKMDVMALAAEFGLSYERFRKIFRQRMGVAPGEYRIRRRIDRARALIAQQHLSNKAVSYTLGYADPFTFSKQFKKVVGISPNAFRRTV